MIMCKNNYTCRFCAECLGTGCIGELPGMGGIKENLNFQLNCIAWDKYPAAAELPRIRLAPVTGGIENVGYKTEESFYYDIIAAASQAGMALSIGDGWPDYKIQYGIHAVRKEQERCPGKKAAVFIKPYSNERIFERIFWSRAILETAGIDIDSWNIVTMRKKAHLEHKTAGQLSEIKRYSPVPFAVKGVFTEADIALLKTVHPAIVVVSNHGGRVDTRTGSTADFLAEYGRELAACSDELWVDGGIRKTRDALAAKQLGASEVLIGRPVISALCAKGAAGVVAFADSLTGKKIRNPGILQDNMHPENFSGDFHS